MSKISANTLRDKDGAIEVAMVYPVRGSAKTWANLNGTGTIALRDSLNIASATDGGTGTYTFNLTTAFAALDYVPNATPGSSAGGEPYQPITAMQLSSASAVAYRGYDGSTSGLVDGTYVTFSAVGDLA